MPDTDNSPIAPPPRDSRSCVSGSALFARGDSGAQLSLLVQKVGPGAREQGEYLRVLGRETCPEVVALLPSGYVMEYAAPAARRPDLLCEIEWLLKRHVWSVPATPDAEWPERLWERCAISVPDWMRGGVCCATHGDCTASNALRRDTGGLIVCDAFPRRPHVAPHAAADHGRILQSAAGWETMLHGEQSVRWEMPEFWVDDESRRRALWWLGATAVRLMVTERARGEIRNRVISWCENILREVRSCT